MECVAKRNRNGIQSVEALLADFSSVYGICFLTAEDEDLAVEEDLTGFGRGVSIDILDALPILYY